MTYARVFCFDCKGTFELHADRMQDQNPAACPHCGAVMPTKAYAKLFDVTMQLAGYPSTEYYARTIVTHLFDYGFTRFEMGYASAIATVLFLTMILCNKVIQKLLSRVGH